MKKIKISWAKFEILIKDLAEKIEKHYTNIYAVPRGGLIVGAALGYLLGIKKVTTDPSKIIETTLIVDDIVDSGETLGVFANYDTAALYYKGCEFKPTYYAEEISRDLWVQFPWEPDSSPEMRDRDLAGNTSKY